MEFIYPVGGSTAIIADENAVRFMSVGNRGKIIIAEDGNIPGFGVLAFSYLSPCQWEAPSPSDSYNCIALDVDDGAFTITGNVVEWVHRHDDDHPLKGALFAYADAYSDTRVDYAPYRISLTVKNTATTTETLIVWGLSGGNVERHTTGASAIGMYVSGLFDTPFELVALPLQFTFLNGTAPHHHMFSGQYQAGHRSPRAARSH